MSPHKLFVAVAFLAVAWIGRPAAAEPPAGVDDAQVRLDELAEWFESLPAAERADAAKKARRHGIEVGDYLFFDTDGDGITATGTPRDDDHALAVDADALREDPRGLEITDAEGTPVEGIRPFAAGWTIRTAAGDVVDVDCPR